LLLWARFSVVSDPEEFVSSYKRRKNRVNKFLSREFGALEQGKKGFFFTHILSGRYFDSDRVRLNDHMMETDISFAAFLQPFDLPVSDCSRPGLRRKLPC
jgi:hypothetical protein